MPKLFLTRSNSLYSNVMLSVRIALFVGRFIHITLHVYVRALHFLFPPALCEALQLICSRVTKLLLSSSTITDTRTVYLIVGTAAISA